MSYVHISSQYDFFQDGGQTGSSYNTAYVYLTSKTYAFQWAMGGCYLFRFISTCTSDICRHLEKFQQSRSDNIWRSANAQVFRKLVETNSEWRRYSQTTPSEWYLLPAVSLSCWQPRCYWWNLKGLGSIYWQETLQSACISAYFRLGGRRTVFCRNGKQ